MRVCWYVVREFCSIITRWSTDGLMTLSLFSMKSISVFGNCPDGRISGGRCFVSTVFSISTSSGSLYFFAHSLGTPSSLLVLKLCFTFSPSETLIGFPFERRSISVWLRVLGSIKVRSSRLLRGIRINDTQRNFPWSFNIKVSTVMFYLIIKF